MTGKNQLQKAWSWFRNLSVILCDFITVDCASGLFEVKSKFSGVWIRCDPDWGYQIERDRGYLVL